CEPRLELDRAPPADTRQCRRRPPTLAKGIEQRGAAVVRISPTRADMRWAVPAGIVHELIEAPATEGYHATCLQILDDSCDADHWALFQYSRAGVVRCLASASKVHAAAARSNVEQFVNRCHRVDPSLI